MRLKTTRGKVFWILLAVFLLVLPKSEMWSLANEDTSLTIQDTHQTVERHSISQERVGGVRFVQNVTADNATSNYTSIHHPQTDNNPDAIIFIAENQTPGRVVCTPVEQNLGVWYNNGTNKWGIFDQYYTNTMTILATYNVLIPEPGENVFVHQASEKTISDHTTIIDNPLTNNNPEALLLITQNWNPGGVGSTYNDHPVAVSYHGFEQKWIIQNDTTTNTMPEGASFNVMVNANDIENAFVHTSTVTNTYLYWTWIDHPLTNGNINALLYITRKTNREEHACEEVHPLGVGYHIPDKRWGIYNQDNAAMPSGCVYNVVVPSNDTDYLTHTATSGNSFGGYTFVDHQLISGRPFSFAFVSQNKSPGGVVASGHNHPVGLWYFTAGMEWAIRNQDEGDMPAGVSFNVLIPNVDARVFLHKVTDANSFENYSRINYPVTNNSPNRLVFVTQNWNPGGSGNIVNPPPIAVFYYAAFNQWTIRNLSSIDLPSGAYFNVMALHPSHNVFVHTSSLVNTAGDTTYINHPLTNNNPYAFVYITRNMNPNNSAFGPANYHVPGVVYDSSEKKWAIFNQDSSDIPENVSFNVLVMAHRITLPIVLK